MAKFRGVGASNGLDTKKTFETLIFGVILFVQTYVYKKNEKNNKGIFHE